MPAAANGGDPTGSFDVLGDGVGGSVAVQGWARDPDDAAALEVHVYVDGRGAALGKAPNQRADLPFADRAHGFALEVDVYPGFEHTICAYAINLPGTPGGNVLLGCKVLPVKADPTGAFDGIQSLPDGRTGRVYGWAVDPDTDGDLGIHVYVDGALRSGTTVDCSDCDVLTGQWRPDVVDAFWRARVFAIDVPLPRPDAQICVYALNTPDTAGVNVLLGCRGAAPRHDAIGAAAMRWRDDGTADIYGWAFDADAAASTTVALYRFGTAGDAGPRRVDWSRPTEAVVVAADRPQVTWWGYPPTTSPSVGAHYFGPWRVRTAWTSFPSGGICAWAINAAGTPGTNMLLDCSQY